MFRFTEAERIELSESYAIATDALGREVLAGLSLEETAFVMAYERGFIGIKRHRGRDERFVSLMNKHLDALHGIALPNPHGRPFLVE